MEAGSCYFDVCDYANAALCLLRAANTATLEIDHRIKASSSAAEALRAVDRYAEAETQRLTTLRLIDPSGHIDAVTA